MGWGDKIYEEFPEHVDPPIEDPPYWIGPAIQACPDGYVVGGYDQNGTPWCRDPYQTPPIAVYPKARMSCPPTWVIVGYNENGDPQCIEPTIDPPPPPPVINVCPPGFYWDAPSGSCKSVSINDPTCMPGAVWDAQRGVCVSAEPTGGGVYVDPTDGPPLYPVDCLPGFHGVSVNGGQPVCVADVIQTVGTPVGTPVITPPVTTPLNGLLAGFLDAHGKLFGFEPVYVIGAAAIAAMFLFSGGKGK